MSKRQLKNIHYHINEFCKKQTGVVSHETRNSMNKRLKTIANDLHKIGYQLPNLKNIKQKHIAALVEHWKASDMSAGTIKNRMSNIRYVCHAYGRDTVVLSNTEYGIEKRSYIPTHNKAIHEIDVSKISDEHLKMSVKLQEQFGLRREECLKMKPQQALSKNNSGDYCLNLQASWTKGGIARQIPIRNAEQMNVIEEAIKLVGKASMIPKDVTYIQRRNQYDDKTQRAGLKNLHGLRHAYAQKRYHELTKLYGKEKGWLCPLQGGPKRREMSKSQKEVDKLAKITISNEMGHSRIAIVKNYIG